MDDQMFADLEASLKEGMAILKGEAQPSRVFVYDTAEGDDSCKKESDGQGETGDPCYTESGF